jgi:hypothetical protein
MLASGHLDAVDHRTQREVVRGERAVQLRIGLRAGDGDVCDQRAAQAPARRREQ